MSVPHLDARVLGGKRVILFGPFATFSTKFLKEGSYRFFFYASDRGELPHIHVERENKVAKFWLNPPRLARSGDFGRAELRRIEQLVVNHREKFLEAWNEFFAD